MKGVVAMALFVGSLVRVAMSELGEVHQQADLDTLKLVQVIFRHGDRGPTNTYPTDPVNDDPNAWPEGMAQLTSVGKMQQYNLGQYLRRRYGGFLAEKYHSQELYVVSSDMDRTIMSVESNLAGLFPPVHKWHPHLDWQPIPLRTIPWKEDQYLHVNTKCPKYEKLHHEFLQDSDVVRKTNEKNRDFVAYLAEKAGVRATTVKEIIHLQDIILTECFHNLTVPQWALDALPRLNELQAELNTWSTYTDEMKRLRGGPLLDLLTKNMLAKKGILRASPQERHMIVGGGNRKMLMYSAHDSTLSRIMNTIGVFRPHNPPYAAALLFELHYLDEQSEYFIKILYRNETHREPYLLEVPNCTSPCSLRQFMDVTQHLVPRNITEECSLDEEMNHHVLKLIPPPHHSVVSCITTTYPIHPIVVTVVGLFLLISTILLWICLCRFLGCCAKKKNGASRFYHAWDYERL